MPTTVVTVPAAPPREGATARATAVPGPRVRTVLGVCGVWLLVAIVQASQAVLEGALQGQPVATPAAFRAALMQTVPWILPTLAIIALAVRFPVTRATWRTALPVHVLGFAAIAWVENLFVVLGFVLTQPEPPALSMILRSAGRWTLLRLHVAALVYVAVAAGTQAWLLYRRTRARELQLARLEGQLARARLDALTAQIRPHFLFNTLHTIGQLWRSGRADDADAMLDHLGDLFQRVQRTTSRPLISLDEELETAEAYLAIESARFRDRMTVEIDVAPDARALAVPPLLLQPIVENAVRHGIAVSSSAGRIRVHGRRENGRLVLEVEDDGPGMNGSGASRGTGTGLRNTRARLEQLFGAEQTLTIGAANGRGTRVHIEVRAILPDASSHD